MEKLSNVFEKILGAIAGLLFMGMLVVVGIQVVARYIPSWTTSWTEELTRLLFVGAVSFGAPLAMKYQEYVGVDLVVELMNAKLKAIMFGIIYLLIAVFCAVTARYGWNFALSGLIQTSPTLKYPMILPYGLICLSFALNTLYALANSISYFIGIKKKEEDE